VTAPVSKRDSGAGPAVTDPLLVIEHGPYAPAGLVGVWAADLGLAVRTVALHAGEPLPATVSSARAESMPNRTWAAPHSAPSGGQSATASCNHLYASVCRPRSRHQAASTITSRSAAGGSCSSAQASA
jgi:hypothetical protein